MATGSATITVKLPEIVNQFSGALRGILVAIAEADAKGETTVPITALAAIIDQALKGGVPNE